MGAILDLFRTLKRRRLLIFSLFVLLAIGVVAGVYVKRPTYEARAKLLLNLGERPISLSRAELPSSGMMVQTVEAVTTLSEIFSSRDLVERLVDELGPDVFESPPPGNPLLRRTLELVNGARDQVRDLLVRAQLVEPQSPRAALVSELENRLSIYPVRQSQVIEVSFGWSKPSVPPLVLRRLLDIYVDRVNALNAQGAEKTVLSEQAEEARAALDLAQARLRALRQDTGIIDPDKEREALTDRIEKLAPLLGHSPQGDADGVAVGGGDGPGAEIAALRRRLNDLRIERAGALAQYTQDSQMVRALDARITAAEQALAAERAQIEAALAGDRKRLEDVLDAEPSFAEAQRDLDLAAQAYQTYSQAANDRNVMRLADEELRLRIIDVPAAQAPASGPSRIVLLIAGLVVAAIAACVIGLFIDRLRAEARRAEQGDDHVADAEEPRHQTARFLRDVDEAPAFRTSIANR